MWQGRGGGVLQGDGQGLRRQAVLPGVHGGGDSPGEAVQDHGQGRGRHRHQGGGQGAGEEQDIGCNLHTFG